FAGILMNKQEHEKVRYAVQQVIRKRSAEGGAHIEGVLLMLGAWPIYSAAFLSHIVGAKIPFIATPKEISNRSDFKLILPHLVISIVLLVSIIIKLFDKTDISALINIFFAAGLILVNSGVFYAFWEGYKNRKDGVKANGLEEIIAESKNKNYIYESPTTNS
ncbi:MAG TPA: hypothetical protein VHP30_09645, partial [Ignavibacteriales bacterium]|nr:hypothetical protein [Ignavibacteriales bacterium]